MDLDFGHGFVPRVGSDNYKAVDRCLGPGQLWADPLELPWAIVDATWAERQPATLDALRGHGTRVVADTFGWRLRFDAAFEIKRLASASWVPEGPVDVTLEDSVRALVRESLRAQARLGVDAYLVPGFVPVDAGEDLRPTYAAIVAELADFTDIPAKPYLLFVGGHTQGLVRVRALLDEIPAFISGLYVQLTPIEPAKDPPAKLEHIASVYQGARDLGFNVIAGYAGAIAPAIRALGLDAADAGLATAETFDQSTYRRGPRRKVDRTGNSKGGARSRIYFPAIDWSTDASEARRVLAVPGAAVHLLVCRLPCHRFTGGDPLERAREHSLYSRVETTREIARLPATMRLQALHDRTREQRSRLTTINGALAAAHVAPLDTKALDNRLVWIARQLESRSAA